MTGILLLAIVVLSVLLYDTRRRLGQVEQHLADRYDVAPAWRPTPAEEQGAAAVTKDRVIHLDPAAELVPVPVPMSVRQAMVSVAEPEQVQEGQGAAPPKTEKQGVEDSDQQVEAAQPASAWSGFGFEDLFGRRLPIWAGGVTLIVAAVLMVKYSIDSGLLSPVVRVIMGMVFSGVLIGMGEAARRRDDLVRDMRVAQALAGAGVGGLYAVVLAAANLYGLVGPGLAFGGLTAITALALGLALRFGAPCAVLALVGGLATPAVVQSQSPSVPLLAGYLAVVIGAITLLSRRQRWVWLGVGALTGGAGWSLVTIALGTLDRASTLAMGLLVLLLGIGLPALVAQGRSAPLLRAATGVVGALQLALLVAQGEFAPLTWGLYGLLSLAFVWLAGRSPELRRTVAVPLMTALALVSVWPRPDAGLFAAVVAGIAVIYGGYALRHLWRREGGLVETGLLCAISLGGYMASHAKFYAGADGQNLRFALLAIAFAVLPAIGAALGWRSEERQGDARFALLACCTGVLLTLAALVGLPEWCAPVSIALVASGLLALSHAARDHRVAKGALGFLGMAVLVLPVTVEATGELARLVDAASIAHPARALLRWSVVTLAAMAFAWRLADTRARPVLQSLSVLLGYGMAAQVIPASWLPVAMAAALLAMAQAGYAKSSLRIEPALATGGAVLALWALHPVGIWLQAGVMSLGGVPVLAGALPKPGMALARLLVPAIAGGFAVWRVREWLLEPVRNGLMVMLCGLAVMGSHALYKQAFAIVDATAFVRLGLAERTVWESLLLAAGMAAWRYRHGRVAAIGPAGIGLVAAGLAHNLFYSLGLHDPLWAEQAVGGWPLVNLLLPAFGIAFAAPALRGALGPNHAARLDRPGEILRMIAVLLFAFATLRQVFAGSLLVVGPVTELENIGRSVLAIALAVGFLLWGIRRGARDWRLASLLLMLGAVGKVFLFDASGLEGLLRIGSFLALGFSLIGIGWLYSRYRH